MPEPIIATRRIAMAPGNKKRDIPVALEWLNSLAGVRAVRHDARGACIEVGYDLLETSFAVLEDALQERNIRPSSKIRDRLLSAWYEYLDGTARDNANAPPAACCDKPPRRSR